MGVAPVSRLLLPSRLSSDVDLRKVAARLHADVLLVYTVDTDADTDDSPLLSFLTLGIAPVRKTSFSSTASAILLDTRTGYVYGTAEASAHRSPRHNAWEELDGLDRERIENERKAVGALADEIARTWQNVLATYSPNGLPSQ